MRDANFSSREREGAYRLIVLLNSSLRFVVLKLEEIATSKVLKPSYLEEMSKLIQQVEAEMDKLLKGGEKTET